MQNNQFRVLNILPCGGFGDVALMRQFGPFVWMVGRGLLRLAVLAMIVVRVFSKVNHGFGCMRLDVKVVRAVESVGWFCIAVWALSLACEAVTSAALTEVSSFSKWIGIHDGFGQ